MYFVSTTKNVGSSVTFKFEIVEVNGPLGFNVNVLFGLSFIVSLKLKTQLVCHVFEVDWVTFAFIYVKLPGSIGSKILTFINIAFASTK